MGRIELFIYLMKSDRVCLEVAMNDGTMVTSLIAAVPTPVARASLAALVVRSFSHSG
jgi:hypothetical protein